MSGWDVSSTHTWGQQDGPDETQTFAAPGAGSRDFGEDFGSQEFGRMAPGSPSAGFPEVAGGFPGEPSPAGPPPEFFGQGYGQQDPNGSGGYPQRTPGRSLQDLSRRDPRDMRSGAQDAGYGQESAYGQDAGYSQESAYGQDWGAAGQGDGWNGGGQDNGGWERTTARPGAPWDDRAQRDAGYQDLDGPGFGRQEPGQLGYSAQDYAGQDYPAQDYPAQDYAGQDYPAQDYPAQDYAGQDYPGQQGRGPQEPPAYDRRGREAAAQMDPALQDFFAPQAGYSPQPGGAPGQPREPRYRQDDDGWDGPGRPQPPRGGTGPRPVPRTAPRAARQR